MKANIEPLVPEHYYHIYNRGINGETIFKKEKHYSLFLKKYTEHVFPYVDTFAYCLLSNHFHLLVRIKSEEAIQQSVKLPYPEKKIEKFDYFLSRQFSHLFNGYTQALNHDYDRTGALFESPFRRKLVDDEKYFRQLVAYIHQNPIRHGIAPDYTTYEHSSYQSFIHNKHTKIARKEAIDWFGNK